MKNTYLSSALHQILSIHLFKKFVRIADDRTLAFFRYPYANGVLTMNFSTFTLAVVLFAVYLQDSILLRLKQAHFPFTGVKSIFMDNVAFGLKYMTYILVSCVVVSALVALTQKIRKEPASDKVSSVITTHALLSIIAILLCLVILPCIKGIAILLKDGANDLYTFWLSVFLFIGFTFAVSVFLSMKAEWSKVIAKATD